MAILSAGMLAGALVLAVVGVVDAANPLSGIYFFMAAGTALAAGATALVARGVWRDRGWAWIVVALIGFLMAVAAWQINQSYYGDGSLLSLAPITPYLAPFAIAGVWLVLLAIGHLRASRQAV